MREYLCKVHNAKLGCVVRLFPLESDRICRFVCRSTDGRQQSGSVDLAGLGVGCRVVDLKRPGDMKVEVAQAAQSK